MINIKKRYVIELELENVGTRENVSSQQTKGSGNGRAIDLYIMSMDDGEGKVIALGSLQLYAMYLIVSRIGTYGGGGG